MRSPIRLQDGDRNMARPHAVLRDRADKEPHHAAFVVRRHRYQRRVQLVSLDADGVAYAVAVAAGARHDGHMVQALRACGTGSLDIGGSSQPARVSTSHAGGLWRTPARSIAGTKRSLIMVCACPTCAHSKTTPSALVLKHNLGSKRARSAEGRCCASVHAVLRASTTVGRACRPRWCSGGRSSSDAEKCSSERDMSWVTT